MAPEPIFNRDLIADLLKLATTVLHEANYDSKVGGKHLFAVFAINETTK